MPRVPFLLPLLPFLLVLASPAAAQAPSRPGDDDPAFAEARSVWLSGDDDMDALGRLSGLAGAGNATAQVMLGAVVAEGLLPATVDALSRAERIALTRAPGGLSGTSWLRVAGQRDPVAHALGMALTGVNTATGAEIDAALGTLLAAGETGAALRVLATLHNIGGFGDGGGWTGVLRHAAHPTLRGHGAPLLAALGDLLADPASGVVNPAALTEVKALLAAMPDPGDLAAPLAAFCAAGCPSTAAACTGALVRATGGLVGVVTLSPVEGLIDSATYQSSPRFATDLRARLSPAADRVAGDDACAAGLIR